MATYFDKNSVDDGLVDEEAPKSYTAAQAEHSTRKYHCAICNITYQSLKGIHLHNLKFHDPEAVWCQICHRPFKKKENFAKHNLQFHPEGTDQKNPKGSRKNKWVRPTVTPLLQETPLETEQYVKRKKLEIEAAPVTDVLQSMDPTTLTAFAWDFLNRSVPFANVSKTKNPAPSLVGQALQPVPPTFNSTSFYQAAPRKEPWFADPFLGTSARPMPADEECSSSRAAVKVEQITAKPTAIPQFPLADCQSLRPSISTPAVTLKTFFEGLRSSPASPAHASSSEFNAYESASSESASSSDCHSSPKSSEVVDVSVFLNDFTAPPQTTQDLWNELFSSDFGPTTSYLTL